MNDTNRPTDLPAHLTETVAGIPASLVPACIKALDRLVGAAVDIPVAWLEYQKTRIVSRTEAFRAIDNAITAKAAAKAGSDDQFADRAIDNLVRKSYRQHSNKEAIGIAMLEELRDESIDTDETSPQQTETPSPDIDDDWLNVFERYAEDASTERMQRLWGRVLAGQIRKPGKYSMRTLRFLSEFSREDAITFSEFCKNSFADLAPRALVISNDVKDMRPLIYLESSGLIQGASGLGLVMTKTFDDTGSTYIREDNLCILFKGAPNTKLEYKVVALTPLGQELVTLLPERNAREAARRVGYAIKTPQITTASLVFINTDGSAMPIEILW